MFGEAAYWSSAEKIRFSFVTLDGKSFYTVKLTKYVVKNVQNIVLVGSYSTECG